MLQINMLTLPLQLSYSIKNAQLNLQTTQPVLQMQTTLPTLEIQQPPGELTIDQTPCRYSIGLKNNTDFARDNAELGRQTVMNGVARIVAEGHRLARIENKSNAVAEIAANSTRSEIPSVTWAHIDAPEIHYQANPVQFNPIEGKVNFMLQQGMVNGNFTPGSVDIRVAQYPNLEISLIDVKV